MKNSEITRCSRFSRYESSDTRVSSFAIQQRAWYKTSLPWIAQEAEETRKLMGDNYWPYGIEPNRKALNALIQYSHEQGLAKRKLKIEELFHASTLALKEKPT